MPKSKSIYELPKYEEILAPRRNIQRQVDFFESIFERYSGSVNSVLDIGCGICPHLIELGKRGYKVSGLDFSEESLKYGESKAAEEGVKMKLYREDMKNFELDETYDAAISMDASIQSLLTNEDYYSHFSSMKKALCEKGLYIIELDTLHRWFTQKGAKNGEYMLLGEWEIENRDEKVSVKFYNSPLDYINEIYEVKFNLQIEGEKEREIESIHKQRFLMPQEFKAILDAEGSFELLRFFGDFDLEQPLEIGSDRMIAVLKKKENI